MTVLKPAPVSSRQINWTGTTGTTEFSALRGLGRVYDDACDEGFTVVSARTGKEVVFVEYTEKRDREGDLEYTVFLSVEGNFVITVFND